MQLHSPLEGPARGAAIGMQTFACAVHARRSGVAQALTFLIFCSAVRLTFIFLYVQVVGAYASAAAVEIVQGTHLTSFGG